MRMLLFGGSRFQGRRAAELLVEAGHEVTLFTRSQTGVAGARHIRGDRKDTAALADLFRRQDYDCVVDNLAYEPDDVTGLLPMMKGRAGHYVLISSYVVYGSGGAALRPVTEEKANLDLSTGGAYDVGKRQCEKALMEGGDGLSWSILRFGNMEGPGDPSNRRGFFIDRVRDGGGVLIPSEFIQPFRPLWRDDAARSVCLAAGNPAAIGQVFNITGEEILTVTEWLDLIAGVLGVPRPYVVSLPYAELRQLAGFHYRVPLPGRPVMAVDAARSVLGYTSTPVNEWLPETVAWWLGSGLISGFWEHRPLEVAALRRVRGLPRTGSARHPRPRGRIR